MFFKPCGKNVFRLNFYIIEVSFELSSHQVASYIAYALCNIFVLFAYWSTGENEMNTCRRYIIRYIQENRRVFEPFIRSVEITRLESI